MLFGSSPWLSLLSTQQSTRYKILYLFVRDEKTLLLSVKDGWNTPRRRHGRRDLKEKKKKKRMVAVCP